MYTNPASTFCLLPAASHTHTHIHTHTHTHTCKAARFPDSLAHGALALWLESSEHGDHRVVPGLAADVGVELVRGEGDDGASGVPLQQLSNPTLQFLRKGWGEESAKECTQTAPIPRPQMCSGQIDTYL